MKLFGYHFSYSWIIILILSFFQFVIHLFSYSNFELHRDTYLYYAQGENLAWGYFSNPPVTAFLVKITTLIFGNSTFGICLIPALTGSINVFIIGMAVKEIGGKSIAVMLACFAYVFSPSFLHVNALFQPVFLDNFFWLLSSYLILILIKRNNPKIWIWIGIVFGISFLTKYSIVFFIVAFILSILISRYRKLIFTKYFFYSFIIGLFIVLPNVFWQYNNNWPVFFHMAELRETQLVHMNATDFIFDQFLMNSQGLALWFSAIIFFFLFKEEYKFRIFGFMYLFVVGLLLIGSGKSYYTLGIYPILFVFGAFFLEKYIKRFILPVTVFLIASMITLFYFSLSFDGVPLLSFEKISQKNGFTWENGDKHDIPQDMADMTGWKEIGLVVSDTYNSLKNEDKNNCDIFCYNYGQAGAVMFYGKKNSVPQPISFCDCFALWAPDSITKKYMIWVHCDRDVEFDPDSLLPLRFDKVKLLHTVNNKYFRENGTRIYLCENPKDEYKNFYKNYIAELRRLYLRSSESLLN